MTGIEEVRAESWAHLQELLFADKWPEHAGQYHSNFIHRGLTNSDYGLLNSLERHGLTHMESHLLRNFVKYSQVPSSSITGEWEWLTIGQHHGLPTRLMDWTYSPLVALHFATGEAMPRLGEETYKNDGVVWSLDFVRTNSRLPRVLRRSLVQAGSSAFTTKMLDSAGVSPTALPGGRSPKDAYMVVLEPPSIDSRVVNQYAGLSAMSSPSINVIDWLESFPEPVAHKIIVPKELKPIVREHLDKANVNERVIFPGLDGLSQWLTRYYRTGPRTP